MENASKALLMAASMLIGILIISLAVYLFATFGAEAQQVNERNKQQQLRQFNEQFTVYEEQSKKEIRNSDGIIEKGNVTIYDVVTVANTAKDNNIYYGFVEKRDSEGNYRTILTPTDSDNYISIRLSLNIGGSRQDYNDLENNSSEKYNELIQQCNGNNRKLFDCNVDISTITGRVYRVTFTENT